VGSFNRPMLSGTSQVYFTLRGPFTDSLESNRSERQLFFFIIIRYGHTTPNRLRLVLRHRKKRPGHVCAYPKSAYYTFCYFVTCFSDVSCFFLTPINKCLMLAT
jgi:hypothetical protein